MGRPVDFTSVLGLVYKDVGNALGTRQNHQALKGRNTK